MKNGTGEAARVRAKHARHPFSITVPGVFCFQDNTFCAKPFLMLRKRKGSPRDGMVRKYILRF
jgi:hypothetical protein